MNKNAIEQALKLTRKALVGNSLTPEHQAIVAKGVKLQREGDVMLAGVIVSDDWFPYLEAGEEIKGYVTPSMLRERVEAVNGAVRVLINSEGGDFFAGIEMASYLRLEQEDGREVTVVNTGLVASAATLPFLAVPIERRSAMPNTFFLFHEAYACFCGCFDAQSALSLHNDLTAMNTQVKREFMDATGSSQEQADALFSADKIIALDVAQELGVIPEARAEAEDDTSNSAKIKVLAEAQKQFMHMLQEGIELH